MIDTPSRSIEEYDSNAAKAPGYDKTVSFTFFGSWMPTFELLEKSADLKSPAYRLFKAIAEYSLYDKEPLFDGIATGSDTLRVLWPIVKNEIDRSVERRKNGFQRKQSSPNRAKVEQALKEHPEATVRAIADYAGVSKSTANRQMNAIQQQTFKPIDIEKDDDGKLPWGE